MEKIRWLGRNPIKYIETKDVILKCTEQDKKFNRFIKKILKKFLSCSWGLISDEDKKLNDKMLEGNTLGIVGIYKHKRYGAFAIVLVENTESILIDCVEDNGWQVLDFTSRIKVFPELGI